MSEAAILNAQEVENFFLRTGTVFVGQRCRFKTITSAILALCTPHTKHAAGSIAIDPENLPRPGDTFSFVSWCGFVERDPVEYEWDGEGGPAVGQTALECAANLAAILDAVPSMNASAIASNAAFTNGAIVKWAVVAAGPIANRQCAEFDVDGSHGMVLDADFPPVYTTVYSPPAARKRIEVCIGDYSENPIQYPNIDVFFQDGAVLYGHIYQTDLDAVTEIIVPPSLDGEDTGGVILIAGDAWNWSLDSPYA